MSAATAEGNQSASELRLVWEPMEIGSTRVKNRIMMTAQTTLLGKDNVLGDRHIDFFRERAKGGAALFITEQQAGHRLSKGSFFEGCSAWEKRAIPQYAKLADAVHEHGARQFIQLFGCGVHDKGHDDHGRVAPALGCLQDALDRAPRDSRWSWSRSTSTTWSRDSGSRLST